MIVLDPVPLGDASLSGGGGSYYDKAGALQTAAPGTPRITYDPADLSKPPALMLEPAARNHIRNNTMQGAVTGLPGTPPTNWFMSASGYLGLTRQIVGVGVEDGIDFIDLRWSGTPTGSASLDTRYETLLAVAASVGDTWVSSVFVKLIAGSREGVVFNHMMIARDSAGTSIPGPAPNANFEIDGPEVPLRRTRQVLVGALTQAGTAAIVNFIRPLATNGVPLDFTIRIGLPQLERDRVTSPIKTSNAAVTRAADVIGPTAGLLYSNVPEPEPLWAAGTYAKGAKVRDAAHVAWESLVDGNTAALPTKTNANWLRLGATNRYAMFDDRNNTQTIGADEIVVALSPRAIAQGLLLGNVDASEIGISVTVPNFGVVYRETTSLVVSASNSSFFRWAFNRIKRKNLFLTLGLPIFFNGVVTVTLRRPGGIAKCGMCLIGPTVEPGPTLMGLSTEIKDYSTTLFNVDGSSDTIPRGYRKLMSMDVVIDNDKIVEAEDQMIAWRQKTVVWIGAASKLDTIIVGRYSSFKKVIESYPRSKMSLQIEGVLS